jgi:hypothetical protein
MSCGRKCKGWRICLRIELHHLRRTKDRDVLAFSTIYPNLAAFFHLAILNYLGSSDSPLSLMLAALYSHGNRRSWRRVSSFIKLAFQGSPVIAEHRNRSSQRASVSLGKDLLPKPGDSHKLSHINICMIKECAPLLYTKDESKQIINQSR